MDMRLAITEVPPPERRGSVIPVTGITPRVIAIFSNIWKRNIAVKPVTISAPCRSRASLIATIKRYIRPLYRRITRKPPMKPSSSTTTEKIKSDC